MYQLLFGFCIILIVIFLSNILSKDREISLAERRKLEQFPQITINNINNGEISEKFDKYAVDQFILRDFFRKTKAFVSTDILRQKDNDNLFERDGAIYKMEYPLNEDNVQKSFDKMNEVYDKYLKGMDVYYAIIPDKNHYLENDDHLKIDYEKLIEISKQELKQMKYIDIEDTLKLKDYYRTDLHWRQENLMGVVSRIQDSMNLENTSRT